MYCNSHCPNLRNILLKSVRSSEYILLLFYFSIAVKRINILIVKKTKYGNK